MVPDYHICFKCSSIRRNTQDNGLCPPPPPPPPPNNAIFCKYIYIYHFSDRPRLYPGRNGLECETRYPFRYVFLLNTMVWHYRTAFAQKAPEMREIVKLMASGPLHFPCKYYKPYIHNIHNVQTDRQTFWERSHPWSSKKWSKVPIIIFISIKYGGLLTLPHLFPMLLNCKKQSR